MSSEQKPEIDSTNAADLNALADRIYAQRDLLPSHIRNPRGHAFRRDDAVVLARAILASDWLRDRLTRSEQSPQ